MLPATRITIILLIMLLPDIGPVYARPEIVLARAGMTASDMAIIINDEDEQSRKVGEYYQKARHIPAGNMIHLSFPAGTDSLDRESFNKLKLEIEHHTPAHVQAYAVTWTKPFRVDCMSVTSAIAFGFSEKYCSNTCGPTKASPYFNSPSLYPSKKFKMRPAMMLAGTSFDQVRKLIDRGIASDHSFPAGKAYLLDTSDTARNARASGFRQTQKGLRNVFNVAVLKANDISNRKDVLFYFTGLPQVPHLDTLHFLPGALADHLTSTGGQLTGSGQMSILRWLEAGATASYGTVTEPCSYQQKFPVPGVAMFYYAKGESAIEAYWKSVAWPGQGVFVGEPLARPFAPRLTELSPGRYELRIFSPNEKQLQVEISPSGDGPFNTVTQQPVHRGINVHQFGFSDTAEGIIRIKW